MHWIAGKLSKAVEKCQSPPCRGWLFIEGNFAMSVTSNVVTLDEIIAVMLEMGPGSSKVTHYLRVAGQPRMLVKSNRNEFVRIYLVSVSLTLMLVKAAGAMCPGPQPRFTPADFFRVQAVMFAHLGDLDRLIASEGLNVYVQPLGGSRATLDSLKPLSMVFVGYGETANVLNRGQSGPRDGKSTAGAFLPSRGLVSHESAGRFTTLLVVNDGHSQSDLSSEPTRGP